MHVFVNEFANTYSVIIYLYLHIALHENLYDGKLFVFYFELDKEHYRVKVSTIRF